MGAAETAYGAASVIHHGLLDAAASVIHHGVLDGVADIGIGIGFIAVGSMTIVGAGQGAVILSIVLGIWMILFGQGVVRGGDVLLGVTFIVSGAGLIMSRSALIARGTGTIALMAGAIARRNVLIGVTLIVSGAALIPYGAWAIANRSLLPGAAALIGLGAGIIAYGPRPLASPALS